MKKAIMRQYTLRDFRRIARKVFRRIRFPAKLLPPIIVLNVDRGRYRFRTKTVVLPAWLCKYYDLPDYVEWYVAHELAHCVANDRAHGMRFQYWCWRLAGRTYHWESLYKPRLYKKMLALIAKMKKRGKHR